MTNAYNQHIPLLSYSLDFSLSLSHQFFLIPKDMQFLIHFMLHFFFFFSFIVTVLFLFFFCSQDITTKTKTSMEVWYVGPPNLAVGVRRVQLKERLFLKVL